MVSLTKRLRSFVKRDTMSSIPQKTTTVEQASLMISTSEELSEMFSPQMESASSQAGPTHEELGRSSPSQPSWNSEFFVESEDNFGNLRVMESEQLNGILDKAATAVYGERAATYGHPRENFQRIADLFTAYLGRSVSVVDVANLMILVKVARLQESPNHEDSIVHIAGYAAAMARAVGIDG